MAGDSFELLGSHVTLLHVEPDAYSLLEWRTPAGAGPPPPHIHRHTDEGVYVAEGRLATSIDNKETTHGQGAFTLIRRGQQHTFWNPDDQPATYLVTITPPGLEGYFAELAAGLARRPSPGEAKALRAELFTRYDVEMPAPQP